MAQPWSHHVTTNWTQLWSQRELRINTNNTRHLQCSPIPDGVKRLRMRKQRILALDAWGACQTKDFSEPRLLHFLIYRKVLRSLTWDIWFSLISNNLLIFQLPDLLLQKCLYILDPLLDSSEKFLWVIWDAVSQPKFLRFVHQMKRNSHFSDWISFYFQSTLPHLIYFLTPNPS